MRKLINTLIIWMLLPMMALAHDPDQISYHFTQQEHTGMLTIHFTPKGALDLLQSLHPDLDAREAIRLADYHQDFTDYFNKTMSIKLKEAKISLSFSDATFKGHDASITFELSGFIGSYEEVDLGISSFTEIYRRTSNHILMPGHEPVVLDREIQHYSSMEIPERQSSMAEERPSQMIMFLVIVVALVLGIKSVYLDKKPVVQQE